MRAPTRGARGGAAEEEIRPDLGSPSLCTLQGGAPGAGPYVAPLRNVVLAEETLGW
jgi:hypothetical protein